MSKSRKNKFAKQLAAGIRRMQKCLPKADHIFTVAGISCAGVHSSRDVCAGLLMFSEDEVLLRTILLADLSPHRRAYAQSMHWICALVDSDDGSGDFTLELPDDLLKFLNWKIGDVLDCSPDDGDGLIWRRAKR